MPGLMLALLLAAPLDEGLKHYGDLDYEACVASLAPAVGKLRGGQRAVAELYLGLCQFALGNEPAARKHLELSLRLDPQVNPPVAASPKERALFDEISRAVAREPRPAPAPKRPPRRPADAPTPEPAEEPPPAEAAAPEPAPGVEPAAAPSETAAAPPTAPPAPESAVASTEPAAQPRWPLVTAGAVTAVSLGTFAGFGVWGLAGRGNLEACRGGCDPAQVADVDRKFWVADIALAFAVVGALTTVILFLLR